MFEYTAMSIICIIIFLRLFTNHILSSHLWIILSFLLLSRPQKHLSFSYTWSYRRVYFYLIDVFYFLLCMQWRRTDVFKYVTKKVTCLGYIAFVWWILFANSYIHSLSDHFSLCLSKSISKYQKVCSQSIDRRDYYLILMYTFSMFEVGGILKLECFPCLSVGCRILTKLLEEMRNFF